MVAGPVQEIKVEPVGAEALKARLAGFDGAGPARILRQHLADEEDLIAPRRNRVADDLFGPAIAVHLGGVDEGDAEIETEVQRGELGGRLAPALAHPPGAETQDRHRAAVRKAECAHRSAP